jgi:hypothetical protein
MRNLLQEGEAEKKKQQDEYNRKMQLNRDELDKAKQEWKDALGKAKTERKAKEAGDLAPMAAPGDILDKAKKALAGLSLGDMSGQFKAAGTFNPAAAWGMAGGNVAQQIAANTKLTAEQIKQLNDKVKGNATFGGDNPEVPTFA